MQPALAIHRPLSKYKVLFAASFFLMQGLAQGPPAAAQDPRPLLAPSHSSAPTATALQTSCATLVPARPLSTWACGLSWESAMACWTAFRTCTFGRLAAAGVHCLKAATAGHRSHHCSQVPPCCSYLGVEGWLLFQPTAVGCCPGCSSTSSGGSLPSERLGLSACQPTCQAVPTCLPACLPSCLRLASQWSMALFITDSLFRRCKSGMWNANALPPDPCRYWLEPDWQKYGVYRCWHGQRFSSRTCET